VRGLSCVQMGGSDLELLRTEHRGIKDGAEGGGLENRSCQGKYGIEHVHVKSLQMGETCWRESKGLNRHSWRMMHAPGIHLHGRSVRLASRPDDPIQRAMESQAE
jgi:hypothetical protein